MPNITIPEIKQNMKSVFKQRKITWRELSERTGLAMNTLVLIMNKGKDMYLSNLIKIADALNVPVTTFFKPNPKVNREIKEWKEDTPKRNKKEEDDLSYFHGVL